MSTTPRAKFCLLLEINIILNFKNNFENNNIKMSCTYEEALQIEEDFLQFAQEIKERNASKQACNNNNNSANTSRSSNKVKKIIMKIMRNYGCIHL